MVYVHEEETGCVNTKVDVFFNTHPPQTSLGKKKVSL